MSESVHFFNGPFYMTHSIVMIEFQQDYTNIPFNWLCIRILSVCYIILKHQAAIELVLETVGVKIIRIWHVSEYSKLRGGKAAHPVTRADSSGGS